MTSSYPVQPVQRAIVLGSTGSIGTQTLAVIEHLSSLARQEGREPPIRVVGLAAGGNAALLRTQAAMLAERQGLSVRTALAAPGETGADITGPDAAERLVRSVECDLVVAAIAGFAGLAATLAAVELGRQVALANKETLVAAGSLIVPLARARGAALLPLDSEHSAIWQCLRGLGDGAGLTPPMRVGDEVSRLVLTASGGPFRTRSLADVYHAPREAALKHPTWTMGRKVTLDSATLTNKALEVIEAHWLFGIDEARIGVLIHPTSIVHSMVELADGAVLAQLGAPDMRVPIQYALCGGSHVRACASQRGLSLVGAGAMEFFEADEARFEPLALARRAIREGGTAGAVFNAASELAAELYLAGDPRVPFGRLPELARLAMDMVPPTPQRSLDDALEADRAGRAAVMELVEGGPTSDGGSGAARGAAHAAASKERAPWPTR